MAFHRTIHPPPRPVPDALTGRMVGIGMNFASQPVRDANIEDTLLHASEVGLLEDDLRVLGVLVQWLEVHHAYVNVDRLVRVMAGHPATRVRTFWAAIARWLDKDRRFARLASSYDGPRIELLDVGTAFHVMRRGEDYRFAGSPLVVPAETLRARAADVLPPSELVRHHAGYRNRVLMGPSWRADVWSLLEARPDMTVAEVARRAYCAFSTAWQTKQDFDLLQAAG